MPSDNKKYNTLRRNRHVAPSITDDDEYRILAYDRMESEYTFIETGQRQEPFHAVMLGSKVTIHRYVPYKAFLFPRHTHYLFFDEDEYEEAVKWAEKNCVEERVIPDWWKSECQNSQRQYREVVKHPDLSPHGTMAKVWGPHHDYFVEGSNYYDTTDYTYSYRKKNREVEYHI